MTATRTRLTKPDRSEQILAAAVKLAARKGFNNLTRDGIAEAAKVSMGLVSHYFGTVEKLRDEVMRAAVADKVLPVIAQGVAAGNKVAMKAPLELRRAAMKSLAA